VLARQTPVDRPFVKAVRIWFLLLLAGLLPARGAVAAAVLCPVGTGGVQQEMVLSGEAARHDAMEHMHGPTAGLEQAAEHGHTAHDDRRASHEHTTSDRCNACSAFCSLTPLVTSVPSVFEPLDPPGVKFSELSAPAPSFLSDGQERPPRTI
jgi:hypothetical protein